MNNHHMKPQLNRRRRRTRPCCSNTAGLTSLIINTACYNQQYYYSYWEWWERLSCSIATISLLVQPYKYGCSKNYNTKFTMNDDKLRIYQQDESYASTTKQRQLYGRCCPWNKISVSYTKFLIIIIFIQLLSLSEDSQTIFFVSIRPTIQCNALLIPQTAIKTLPRYSSSGSTTRTITQRTSTTSNTTTTTSLDDSFGTIISQPSSSSQPNRINEKKWKQKKKSKASSKDEICTLFRQAKQYEKIGQWSNAIYNYEYIIQELNPNDAHSYLALAKLQTKRQQYDVAQQIYSNGLMACPQSIHLLQAYAIYEETITNNITRAKELYESALIIDQYNPYVCHAYACMERKMGNTDHAIQLLQQTLQLPQQYSTNSNINNNNNNNNTKTSHSYTNTLPTAAVVCTLGELYILQNQYDMARQVYEDSIQRIITGSTRITNTYRSSSTSSSESLREQIEIYLAYAWLEERYYNNMDRAESLLLTALQICPKGHNAANMVQIALARFDGRRQQQQQQIQYQQATTTTLTESKQQAVLYTSSDDEAKMTKSSLDICTTLSSLNIVQEPSLGGTSSIDLRMDATARRLASACITLEQQQHTNDSQIIKSDDRVRDVSDKKLIPPQQFTKDTSNVTNKNKAQIQKQHHQPTDGRVYNAWANIEVKAKRYYEARKILHRGLIQYPYDYTLLQAMGKVQERLGNYTGAEYYYSESLRIQPSAPTLVAYALFNLHHIPKHSRNTTNVNDSTIQNAKNISHMTVTNFNPKFTLNETKRLFEEALMIDRRHGPAYNAFARTVIEYENDYDMARSIYKRGIRANCTDVASIYHGYARLELSLGNVELARNILIDGQHEVNRINIGTDSPHRERAVFLTHSLGMIELNNHRPLIAYDVFVDGIDRYGNSSQLLLGAALTLVKLGKERQARKYFEQAVIADEKHAQAWQAWGMMEMRSGNFKASKVLLECGIRSAPRYGPLWHAYGILESRMGNVEMARTLYEKGIDVAPDHVGLYQSWATLEVREENYNAAKALIAKALTRDKHNGVGWLIAADIEERMGHHGLSLLVLRRGIECSVSSSNNNYSARLYRALGDALVRRGKIKEAREAIEQGIAIDPMHAPLYHSLAELEARVGNVEELAKLNKRTATIFSTNSTFPLGLPNKYDTLNSQYALKQKNQLQSSSVPEGVSDLVKRIVPEDVDGITSTNYCRRQTDSSAFLDNLMSSYCLDDDGLICELVQGVEDNKINAEKQ